MIITPKLLTRLRCAAAVCLLLGVFGCGLSGTPLTTSPPPPQAPNLVYVANRDAGNIAAFSADSAGALSPIAGSPFNAGVGLSALAANSSGSYVYTVGYNNTGTGSLYAFSVAAATGVLSPVSGSPFLVGTEPLAIVLSPAGSFIFVANYSSSNISVFRVSSTNGLLTEIAGSPFPAGGHPYTLAIHPAGNFLYAGDNQANVIMVYRISPSGALAQISGSPISVPNSPWSLSIHPAGNYLYAANEDLTNTISGFSLESNGTPTLLANSPFAISAEPISLTIDPSGTYLYAADYFANNVSGLSLDAATGNLSQMPLSPFSPGAGGTGPASLAVNSTTKIAYVTYFGDSNLGVFPVDSSGNIGVASGSLVSLGTGAGPVAVVTALGKP